jgi:hypothetical protein
MILVDLAIVAFGLLFAWILGGLLLRVGGLILALGGAGAIALTGNANGILVFATGAALWLAGHWLYALRHHEYKSPLAGYVFLRWAPAWLDPTRDWAVPVGSKRADYPAAEASRGTADLIRPHD